MKEKARSSTEDRAFCFSLGNGYYNMKRWKGLKIYTFLSLGIHLLFFLLFTHLFPDSYSKPSWLQNRPIEVFISKIDVKPQPKRISIHKPILKQASLTPTQPDQNPTKTVASEPPPAPFLTPVEDVEEKPQVVSLKETFPLIGEKDLSIEDDLAFETDLPIKNPLPKEPTPIIENHLNTEIIQQIIQPPSSEIPFEAPKENPYAKKETPLIYPRSIENPKPIYPREARKRGYEGEVILRVEVLTNGRVGAIEIRRSSGYEILDRSAMETIKKWRFLPAQKGEDLIPFWVNIPIKFQLE